MKNSKKEFRLLSPFTLEWWWHILITHIYIQSHSGTARGFVQDQELTRFIIGRINTRMYWRFQAEVLLDMDFERPDPVVNLAEFDSCRGCADEIGCALFSCQNEINPEIKVKAWLTEADLSVRAYNGLALNYCDYKFGPGYDKPLRDLVKDVLSGDIKKCRNIGSITAGEIKEQLEKTGFLIPDDPFHSRYKGMD